MLRLLGIAIVALAACLWFLWLHISYKLALLQLKQCHRDVDVWLSYVKVQRELLNHEKLEHSSIARGDRELGQSIRRQVENSIRHANDAGIRSPPVVSMRITRSISRQNNNLSP
jgi:hypothetical protein